MYLGLMWLTCLMISCQVITESAPSIAAFGTKMERYTYMDIGAGKGDVSLAWNNLANPPEVTGAVCVVASCSRGEDEARKHSQHGDSNG
jgi:ubiquinone/menaquinone biosynthesis C-methylase UbiE